MVRDEQLADRLRSHILDVPDFPRPGVTFRDITALLADASAFTEAVDAMAEPFRGDAVSAVAGVESRGFILGGAIARALGAGFITVRKQGRLPRPTVTEAYRLEYGEAVIEAHADAVTDGEAVLIVDDLLATGGTAAAAASLLSRLGARIVGLSFLVELAGLGGAAALGSRRHTSLVVL